MSVFVNSIIFWYPACQVMNIYLRGNRIRSQWYVDDSLSESNSIYANHVIEQLISATRVVLEDMEISQWRNSPLVLELDNLLRHSQALTTWSFLSQINPVYTSKSVLKTNFTIIFLSVGWGSIPNKRNRLFCTPQRPDRLWGPLSLLFSGQLSCTSVVMATPPSGGDVKNSAAIPLLPDTSLWHHV
jgi:hypothetical protein